MPRLRHRHAGVRRQWDIEHKFFLAKGICLGTGEWREYDCLPVRDIPPAVLDDMADAWEHFRDQQMHDVENDLRYWAGKRPWAFWAFDCKRDDTMTEAEQLEAMGLLFPGEREELSDDRRSFWKPGEFDRDDAGEIETTNTINTPEE